MESSRPPTIAKKLWHIFQVVYYMLRKGMPKRKLMMDLHLLLKRGKIAGKALGNLMTSHSHHHHHSSTTTANAAASFASGGGNGFSCRSMDPNLSFYNPREVEFSCSNTPSYPSLAKHSKKRHHHHHHSHRDYDYEAATAIAIAKAFEILNTEAASDLESSVAPSPMKTPMLWFGKSPAVVRQLRITDSPFPLKEDEAAADGEVDKEAEEFIRRFYEQLRRQQSIGGATPDYYRARRG